MKLRGMCFALTCVVSSVSIPASAETVYKDCTVTRVFYDRDRLRVTCDDGAAFWGVLSCGALTNQPETIRIWASLSQAALLSGKRLNIAYDPSFSLTCLYSLELLR